LDSSLTSFGAVSTPTRRSGCGGIIRRRTFWAVEADLAHVIQTPPGALCLWPDARRGSVSGVRAEGVVAQWFEYRSGDVLVDDRGVDVGDFGAFGETAASAVEW
jgi:hypothetical protein